MKTNSKSKVGLCRLCVWILALILFHGSLRAQTWQPANLNGGAEVFALEMNPATGHLYAGTRTGMYRSVDTGDTWQAINTGLTTLYILSLGIDSSGNIMTGTYGGGFFYSPNGGDNWFPITLGMPSLYVWSLAVASTGQIFAGTSTGLYTRPDGGLSWSRAAFADTAINRIAIGESDVICVGSAWEATGVFRSTDAGTTWTRQTGSLDNVTVWALSATPNGDFYAGTDGNGIHVSYDNGINWSLSGVPFLRIQTLNTWNTDYILAGTYFGGVWRKRLDGTAWSTVNQGLQHLNVATALVTPDEHIFLSTYGGGFYRNCSSEDSTDTDNDGFPDVCDVCSGFDDASDTDGDAVPDSCDNCPYWSDPDQADDDGDGIGNPCDVGDTLTVATSGPIHIVMLVEALPNATEICFDIDSNTTCVPILDPERDSIGLAGDTVFNTILSGSSYDTLTDYDNDLIPDDIVKIPAPVAGNYRVRLVPDASAEGDDTFTLTIKINGSQYYSPDGFADALVSDLADPGKGEQVWGAATTLAGDVNADHSYTSADIIYLVNYIFKTGAPPIVVNHGDVDCGGSEVSADIIYMVQYIFKGGLSPCSQSATYQ